MTHPTRTIATAQERNLFSLWKKNPRDTSINLAFGFKTKKLDIKKLSAALNQIVLRHDRFRSFFTEENGIVYRSVAEPTSVCIEAFESKNLRDFVRPFDLESPPLFRVAVQGETILLDFCHIVTDGFSMAVFFSELNAFYSGESLSYEPTALPADNEDELNKNTAFWAAQFKNPFPLFRLPCDKNGAGGYGGEGSSLVHRIGVRTTHRVQKICRSLSITPFVFYFSAFLLFLSKESGVTDIVTATNLSCRSPSTMRSIGFLATIAPIRAEIPVGASVREFLRNVDRAVRAALSHQKFDSEKLLSRVGLSDMRDFSRTIFTFEHARIANIRLNDEKCEFVPVPSRHSQTDFSLCFFPFKDEGLILAIFRADLFSHAQIRKFVRSYVRCIEHLLHIDETVRSDF